MYYLSLFFNYEKHGISIPGDAFPDSPIHYFPMNQAHMPT